jgi:hypothetical protein
LVELVETLQIRHPGERRDLVPHDCCLRACSLGGVRREILTFVRTTNGLDELVQTG